MKRLTNLLTKLLNIVDDIFLAFFRHLLEDKDMIPIKRYSEDLGEDPRFIVIKSDQIHLIRACRQDADVSITIEIDRKKEYILFPKGDNIPLLYEDDRDAPGTPTYYAD